MSFPSPCMCENLRRASRTVTRIYDDALRPLDLRVTQFSVLSALAQHPELRVRDLPAGIALDETATLRTLAPLIARKLVTIRTGDDRRARHASLTAAGRALLAAAAPLWRAAQKRLRAQLSPVTWDTLLAALPTLVEDAA